MRTIVLTSNNLVQDGQNNKLVYQFPNSILFKNTYVALQSASLYYSWFNISSALGNNVLSFNFPNTSGAMVTRTITFPDGIYEISDLNAYFQFYCLENGYYYTTPVLAGGQNVFYMTLEVNLSRYAIQINAYTTPNSGAGGNPDGLIPAFGTAIPATSQTLQPIIVPNFNVTVGWPTGSWTGRNFANDGIVVNTTGSYLGVPFAWNATSKIVSYVSPVAPQVNPNGSIFLSLNNINNPYAIPSTTIYAITPTGSAGSAIIEKPPEFVWNKFIDGTYNQLVVTFLGLDGNPITIQDPQMTVLLAIKDGDEWAGKA